MKFEDDDKAKTMSSEAYENQTSESVRIVVAMAYGGPEVLALREVPVPKVGHGQVSVAIRASGVNPIDYKLYGGGFGTNPANLPLRIGFEAAGVVTATGEEAVGPTGPISVGDEVLVYRAPGAYATQLVVPASSVLAKPANLPWDQAGGSLAAGTTAVHALEAVALEEGETVLIHGAAGGVGHLAVQLAVTRGATVIGTASPGKHDVLRELGAIPVAYGPGLADRVRAAAPQGVNAAADMVGSDEAIDTSLEVVSDRSRIATIAGFARGSRAGVKLLGGVPGADPGQDIRYAARLRLIIAAATGTLRVIVSETFPLNRAADAHRSIMSGRTIGKIVLLS
ncbi:NADP-dependent oxidoreductase [Burkholderia pyrrocinia]|uniref:NADP-dependent oxidoreductase n=1 Tax=Burkholderia pyrrocinia TaxID=60550 RepID=UPI001FB507E3|nr:NADP-dependent oxidoreductase [Burkholderia pyrrocinia]UOB58064.1 NADP-dependent oxidoreductase [Burkholderia pyrrocinia]